MDLNALRQFLVVARLEHLSRAADELHIAQPSLSRTIARLESELGTPLFDRAGRLRLNDTGKLFRGYVERSLGELDAGRRAVAEATSEGVGAVRLASETFLTLTGPLAAYKRAHPIIEVELKWTPAEDMARRLRAQDVDLCLASQPINADGLEAIQLLDEAVGVAAPLGHPLAGRTSVSIDELAEQPLVTARKGHWQRRLLDRLFAARDLRPKIVCEVDEPSAIADLIGAGLGVGLVPAIARRTATRTPLVWITVDSPDCRRTLTLYWGVDSHLSTAARLMRTTITSWNWNTHEPQEELG
ncbi:MULTISPECIES: LysR substrate-binding domain-containing protein [unclassified Streptomyces]|uniref:LysR substrate-binding domain-containing protein n=1 Tax=unclassified Streptomyces TaxID=2593676 RepID=UPI00224D52A9|nr:MULTISPECIES: LysR substrate-binding domain-containing protein [unclassified Streptomyces]MCX5106170.1 LysR substrate-binding domain-containing protein [Streptomyces sp. NBC_00439]WSP46860.1 LysR substrate-binding domain-containing protein [Streptomyces sp. NBC_01243]